MKNKLLASMLVTTAITTVLATAAMAQTANSNSSGVKTPFFDTAAGKLSLTANVGYVYNFDSKWDSSVGTGKANGGFGYGARLGYTSSSGLGLSADYLGFTSKWSNGRMEYTNPYHVITITPSYRFSFGESKEWGLKVGLGVGMSLADVSWGTAKTAKGANGKVAGGAAFEIKTASPAYVNDFTGNANINSCMANLATKSVLRIADSNTGLANVVNGCFDGSSGAVSGTSTITDADIAAWLIGKGVKTNAAGTALDATSLSNANINLLSGGGAVSSAVLTAVKTATDAAAAAAAAKAAADAAAAAAAAAAAKAAADAAAAAAAAAAQAAAAKAAADAAAAAKAAADAQAATCTNGGGTWNKATSTCTAKAANAPATGGKAKDDAGFVLAPEVALEYDNGLLHADINARYIHGLANVKYDGQSGASNQLQKSGPLAIFIGVGFGANF